MKAVYRKKIRKERKMDKRLRTAYINKMVPHLLAIRAKSIGITPANKAEWRDLAQTIKNELAIRFSTVSNEEILKDMSFNKKPLPVVSAEINYKLNDEIVQNIPRISKSKKEWIRDMRANLLDIAIKDEKVLSKELINKGIKVYQKMPFVVSDNIYFANLYLPDYNLIIEILKKGYDKKTIYGKLKQRLKDLKCTGNEVWTVNVIQIRDKDYINRFINKILQK